MNAQGASSRNGGWTAALRAGAACAVRASMRRRRELNVDTAPATERRDPSPSRANNVAGCTAVLDATVGPSGGLSGQSSVHTGSVEPVAAVRVGPDTTATFTIFTVDEALDRERIGGTGDEIDGRARPRCEVTERAGHELAGRRARRNGGDERQAHGQVVGDHDVARHDRPGVRHRDDVRDLAAGRELGRRSTSS